MTGRAVRAWRQYNPDDFEVPAEGPIYNSTWRQHNTGCEEDGFPHLLEALIF